MEPTYREIGEFAYSIFFIFSQESAAPYGTAFSVVKICVAFQMQIPKSSRTSGFFMLIVI